MPANTLGFLKNNRCCRLNNWLPLLERGSFVRGLLVCLLVLNTLHFPVLCLDLDGECRGTPINSVSEAHAWHVLLLGVRPNNDIDRGPIRTNEEGSPENPADAPFGDLPANAAPGVRLIDAPLFAKNAFDILSDALTEASLVRNPNQSGDPWTTVDSTSFQAVSARLCVWRI